MHQNDGVGNKTAYLISQGRLPVRFNGHTVDGIDAGDPGLAKTGRLYLETIPRADLRLAVRRPGHARSSATCERLAATGTGGFDLRGLHHGERGGGRDRAGDAARSAAPGRRPCSCPTGPRQSRCWPGTTTASTSFGPHLDLHLWGRAPTASTCPSTPSSGKSSLFALDPDPSATATRASGDLTSAGVHAPATTRRHLPELPPGLRVRLRDDDVDRYYDGGQVLVQQAGQRTPGPRCTGLPLGQRAGHGTSSAAATPASPASAATARATARARSTWPRWPGRRCGSSSGSRATRPTRRLRLVARRRPPLRLRTAAVPRPPTPPSAPTALAIARTLGEPVSPGAAADAGTEPASAATASPARTARPRIVPASTHSLARSTRCTGSSTRRRCAVDAVSPGPDARGPAACDDDLPDVHLADVVGGEGEEAQAVHPDGQGRPTRVERDRGPACRWCSSARRLDSWRNVSSGTTGTAGHEGVVGEADQDHGSTAWSARSVGTLVRLDLGPPHGQEEVTLRPGDAGWSGPPPSERVGGMDAISTPPAPTNEPNLDYAPGSPERAAVEAELAHLAAAPGRPDRHHRRPEEDGRRRRDRGRPAARAQGRARRAQELHQARRAGGRQGRGRRGPRLACAVLRGPRLDHPQGRRPARRSVAGAAQRGHDARPVQDRVAGRDRRGLRADRLLALQRALRARDPRRAADRQQPRRVEPHRPPAARGLRLRDHAVQLHRHRGQPADRAGADGQHRHLEAVADPAARRPPDDGAARGGRAAAGRDQHAPR